MGTTFINTLADGDRAEEERAENRWSSATTMWEGKRQGLLRVFFVWDEIQAIDVKTMAAEM